MKLRLRAWCLLHGHLWVREQKFIKYKRCLHCGTIRYQRKVRWKQ